MIEYKFNEDVLLKEFKEYIDKTYSQHYAADGQIQSLEVIIDRGHGKGFTHGNIDKYNGRYGKKAGYNRKDIQKILHYALLALYVHDKEQKFDGLKTYSEKSVDDYWIKYYPEVDLPRLDKNKMFDIKYIDYKSPLYRIHGSDVNWELVSEFKYA